MVIELILIFILLISIVSNIYFLRHREKTDKKRISYELLLEILDKVNVPIVCRDQKSQIIYANEQFCSLHSKKIENVINTLESDLYIGNYNKDYKTLRSEKDSFILQNEKEFLEYEGSFIDSNGQIVVQHISSRVHDNKGQRVICDVFISKSDVKKLEKDYLELHKKYDVIEENLPVVFFHLYVKGDGEKGFYYINARCKSMFGSSSDEIKKDINNIRRHAKDIEKWEKSLESAIKHEDDWAYEGRIIDSEGKIKWIRVNANIKMENNIAVLFGAFTDISDQKEYEKIIHQQKMYLGTIIQHIPIGVFAKDPQNDFKYTLTNGKLVELFGQTYGNILFKKDKEIFRDKELITELERQDRRVLETQDKLVVSNLEFDSDIGRINTQITKVPLYDSDGQIHSILGIMIDVSEQIIAEEALRQREAKLNAIVDNSVAGIVIADSKGNLLFINKTFSEMIGYTIEELRLKRVKDITFQEDVDTGLDLIKELYEGKSNKVRFEKRYVRKDGSIFWTEIYIAPLKDENGVVKTTLATIVDINYRVKAKKELSRRDAILEAVGFASKKFLDPDDWEKDTNIVIKNIGKSTNASRVCLFKNKKIRNGEIIAVNKYEWTDEKIVSESIPFAEEYSYHYSLMKHIVVSLEKNEYVICQKDDTDLEKKFVADKLNVLSILFLPIVVDDIWKATVSFDYQDEKHDWTENEIEALLVIVNAIGSAINRQKVHEQLNKLNIELEQRVEHRTLLLKEEIFERRMIEKSLRQSEESFRGLIEKAPMAIFITNVQGFFEYVNPTFCSIFDYGSDGIIGKHFSILYEEKQRPIFQRLHDDFVIGIKEDIGEREMIQSNGKKLEIYVNSTLVKTEDGKIRKYSFLLDRTNQKKMQETAKKLQLGIEKNYDAFVITDINGNIQYANAAFEEITGHKIFDAIGENVNILKSGKQSDEFYEDLWKVISKGENWQGSLINKKKNGELYFEEMTIVPVINQYDVITNYVAIKRDISKLRSTQEEIKKSEEKYRQIFENASEGIVLIHYDTIKFVNPAFLSILGHTESEVISKKFPDFIYEADKELLYRNAPNESNKFLNSYDMRIINRKEEIKWVAVKNTKVNWENIPITLMFISDINDRKDAEQALEDERTYLAERVIERTEELSALNAELSSAVRTKDEFLANMSHELRTPLNAILGLSEILFSQISKDLSDKQLKALLTIKESGQHLLSLINDILDLSKIEAGKLDLATDYVPLEPICKSSLQFIKQMALKKNIKVNFEMEDPNAFIWGDQRRIKQILINILNNAVKFTPDNKAIGMEVKILHEESIVRISIWDHGIGIADSDMGSLFKPFVQIDSDLSRRYEGTGLGLSLVARLVEMHRGSISVESTVAEGSRFTVALPLKNADDTEFSSVETVDIDLSQIGTILVVEDNDKDIDIFQKFSVKNDIEIIFAHSGRQVQNVLFEENIDLVFLSSNLQDRSAWEALAVMKSSPRTNMIPVVVNSVLTESTRSLALGANLFISKPLDDRKIIYSLQKISPERIPEIKKIEDRGTKEPLILLAEDNEANIETMEAFLQEGGYKVIVARNGQEAIEWVYEERPDLILMDIQMPKMNGLEAIQILKSTPEFVSIPIIALTALAMPGDKEKCLNAGANEYLSKPVSINTLFNAMTTLLQI